MRLSIQNGLPIERYACLEFERKEKTKAGKKFQNEGSARKCRKCDRLHTPVHSFADLTNRSVLLILVDKGRLGDTFPKSLRVLDQRARHVRSDRDDIASYVSSIVQELGRLCGYYNADDPAYQRLPKV